MTRSNLRLPLPSVASTRFVVRTTRMISRGNGPSWAPSVLLLSAFFACFAQNASAVLAKEPKEGTMAEEKMTKQAMAAKEMLMQPAMMDAMQKEMMADDGKMPMMVAEEMAKSELMQDDKAKEMVMEHAMAEDAGHSMKMHEQVMEAQGKMMAEPTAMQALFKELVARHLAQQTMEAMMNKGNKMSTMAGEEMKKMVSDKEMMMQAHKEMSNSPEMAMMVAREDLIHSLMLDKEVMSMVEKAAQMSNDSKMAAMMSEDKMHETGAKMAKDPKQAKAILQGAMAREKAMSMRKSATKNSAPAAKPAKK